MVRSWAVEARETGAGEEEEPALEPLFRRRSLALWAMEQRRPHVPLFPGPLLSWPRWYLHDAGQIDAAVGWEKRLKQRAEQGMSLADELLQRFGKGG